MQEEGWRGARGEEQEGAGQVGLGVALGAVQKEDLGIE